MKYEGTVAMTVFYKLVDIVHPDKVNFDHPVVDLSVACLGLTEYSRTTDSGLFGAGWAVNT